MYIVSWYTESLLFSIYNIHFHDFPVSPDESFNNGIVINWLFFYDVGYIKFY